MDDNGGWDILHWEVSTSGAAVAEAVAVAAQEEGEDEDEESRPRWTRGCRTQREAGSHTTGWVSN